MYDNQEMFGKHLTYDIGDHILGKYFAWQRIVFSEFKFNVLKKNKINYIVHFAISKPFFQ